MTQKDKLSDSNQRTPKQERSKERVSAILNATKVLIYEIGSANIKITEIADRAGVSVSSIYQYFPNKQAIINALYEEYIALVEEMITNQVQDIESIEQLSLTLQDLFYQYYKLYRDTPALQDIVASRTVDKLVQQRDLEESRHNAQLLWQSSKHLLPEAQHDKLYTYLFMIMHLSVSMVQLAVSFDQAQADEMMSMGQKLISARSIETVFED